MNVQPILIIKVSITIDTMLDFDGHGDVTCKQTFTEYLHYKATLSFTATLLSSFLGISLSTSGKDYSPLKTRFLGPFFPGL